MYIAVTNGYHEHRTLKPVPDAKEDLTIQNINRRFSMTGTEASGNPWQYHMNPDSIVGAFIDHMCTSEKPPMGRSTWTFHLILVTFEKEAREFMGDKLYQEYLVKYSKDLITQKLEKDSEKAKEESKDKEVEAKTKFLEAETTAMQDKHESKEEQELRKNTSDNHRKLNEELTEACHQMNNPNATPEQRFEALKRKEQLEKQLSEPQQPQHP